jgi:hypothetical protein
MRISKRDALISLASCGSEERYRLHAHHTVMGCPIFDQGSAFLSKSAIRVKTDCMVTGNLATYRAADRNAYSSLTASEICRPICESSAAAASRAELRIEL